MVVEDRSTEMARCGAALARLGFKGAKIFNNASSALSHLQLILEEKASRPSALVLDLDLPFGSGHEILRFCRSNPQLRSIPIIVWTRLEDSVQKEICLYMGASAYVAKHKMEELKTAIRAAIESNRILP